MDRLSKEQWLDHGLQNLATSGFTSLKADKLAKSLGVSRGSFYWHFKDLADFHTAVLARWRDLSVVTIIEEMESTEANPAEKLGMLIRLAANGDLALGQAIRAWAFNDPTVKQAVESVDVQCMEYVQHLLHENGVDDETASARARLIYCGYLGQIMLGEAISDTQRTVMVEELVGLAIQNR